MLKCISQHNIKQRIGTWNHENHCTLLQYPHTVLIQDTQSLHGHRHYYLLPQVRTTRLKKLQRTKCSENNGFLTPFALHVFHFILVLFSLAFVLHFVGIYLYVQLRGCFADWQWLPRPLRLIHYHLIAHLRPRVIVRVISFCDELPVRCLWTNVRVGRVGEPGRRIFTLCKLILELCYYRPYDFLTLYKLSDKWNGMEMEHNSKNV